MNLKVTKFINENLWESYWNNVSNHDWWLRPAPEVVDFIKSFSPNPKLNILDLGCGLGRHAIAFAVAGFSVSATDFSEAAIEYLLEWAQSLHLSIETRVCNVLEDGFPEESFDIVLSYNVIYHGTREQFVNTIFHVRELLKPNGTFFFTCPSRQDGKYGFGEMIAPHTYRCEKSVTPGDIHYFADHEDLDEFLEGFNIIKRWKSEGKWDNNGKEQFFSNWHILAEKR